MTSLVLQLQAEALDPATRIADLLRKCRVVAAKLNLDEFAAWVEDETNGYSDAKTLPGYRRLVGRLMAWNSFRGWIPAVIGNREMELAITTCYVTDAIGPLEETILRSINSSGFVVHPFSGEIQEVLARLFGFSTEYQIHLPAASATGILNGVRNQVLDWAMTLEREGILGEGVIFSVRERDAAKSMTGATYNIHGNVGVLGDVAHSTVKNHQSVGYSDMELAELHGIMSQIGDSVGQLPSEVQKPVLDALMDARTELNVAKPNHARLRAALTSIRATCEGVAGNLIAAGIVALVAKFLS